MRAAERGIVLIGDVVGSKRDLSAASAWSRRLSAELTAQDAGDQLAAFDFAQGDEVQGLLRPEADPFAYLLHAFLHEAAPPMRWAVVSGPIEAGEGTAIQRTGAAFVDARSALAEAKHRSDPLLVSTGDRAADALLDDLAPVFAANLQSMTPRQRTIARLMLLEGCRQSDVAARLGVSRATVSVAYGRGRVRDAGRLLRVTRRIFAEGQSRRIED